MKKYRPDIDGLRAIAILSVVFFHFFPRSLRGGYAGVDIFFVISGYLISSIMLRDISIGKFNLSDFYSRRVQRIFPALIFVLLVSILFGLFFLFPNDLSKLGKHAFSGSFFFSNITLLNEAGYFDSSAEFKPLLHLWSLSIEEQFYIIWPLILYFLYSKRLNLFKSVLFLIVISFSLNVLYLESRPSAVFYLPYFRFWEILVGVSLAIIESQKKIDQKWANIRSFIGIASIFAAIGFLKETSSFPGWWALPPVLGTVLIISSWDSWFNKNILESRILIFIGLISYPLYLWHWPVIVFYKLTFGTEANGFTVWIQIIFSFTISYLTYKLIEAPLKIKFFKYKTFFLCLMMCLVALIGLGINLNAGLPSRFPDKIRELAQIVNPLDYFKYHANIRHQICHEPHSLTELSQLEKNCISPGKEVIFLWGDSFAAAIYPGLKKIIGGKNISLAQFTVGNAPPFFGKRIGSNGISLDQLAKRNLFLIKKYKPKKIVLSWMFKAKNAPEPSETLNELMRILGAIKEASPRSEILVIGPVPQWERGLVSLYLYFWRENKKILPRYSNYRLNKAIFDYDQILKTGLKRTDVKYLSTIPVFCNSEGCLTRIKNIPETITFVDYSHLTPTASEYLIESLKLEILN